MRNQNKFKTPSLRVEELSWVALQIVILLIAPCTAYSQEIDDFAISAGDTQVRKYLNGTFDMNVLDIYSLDDPGEWGIIGETLVGGYIEVRVETTEEYGSQALIDIQKFANNSDGNYHRLPMYLVSNELGGVLNEYKSIKLDEDPNELAVLNLPPEDGGEVWLGTHYKRAIARAHELQFGGGASSMQEQPTIDVRIRITLKNATLRSLKIPGIGEIELDPTMWGKGVFVTVTHAEGEVTNYLFAECNTGGASSSDASGIVFPNSAEYTVSTVAGDKVTYQVFGVDDELDFDPVIRGVPKVYPVTFAAQRQFLTIPDYGPNQYYPWMAFEAQTHFRQINSYPGDFQVKTDDWDRTKWDDGVLSWSWTAQRRTDPALDKYEPDVYYPKTRSDQRESQALGWAAQFLHFYNELKEGNTIPKYITGFDIDDWLIPEDNVALTAYNYTESDPTIKNQNWQHMWSRELKSALDPKMDAADISVDNPLAGEQYPLYWDGTTGFRKGGFLTNDMITAYQVHKSETDDDPYTDLEDGYYFNGYEIQDRGTHYVNASNTPSVLGTRLTRDDANNKPAPCKFDCWFNAEYSTGNIKHPGAVSVQFNNSDGSTYTVSFKQEVTSPIADAAANPNDGFFGSMEGPQWPMGFGNYSTYTLKGVSQEDVDAGRISFVMYEYEQGAMVRRKVLNTNELTYDAGNKTLSGTFQIYSSWMALAALYKAYDGSDEVIIAGRVPMVMDPLTSVTIPGGDPNPYDKKSLAADGTFWDPNTWSPDNSLSASDNLNEGQGDRSYETMNEFRTALDPGRGYTMKNGEGYSKPYVREYVLQKGNQNTFSCIGAGRKIQSFWYKEGGIQKDDPYQSWRELARRMPQDIVAQRVNWTIYRIDENTGQRGASVHSETSRHLTYTFNELGEFEVEQLFNGDTQNPTKVHITVVDNGISFSDNYTNLNKSIGRGTIKITPLSEDERRWLQAYGASDADLDNYRIAEVEDIPSYYTYNKGPRANSFKHREGEFNDFNNAFSWAKEVAGFSAPDNYDPESSKLIADVPAVAAFLTGYDPRSEWPDSWAGKWVHHIPGRATNDELTGFTRVYDGKDSDATSVETYIGNTFTALNEAQSVLGWLRWHPWIASSPSAGYKFNRYVKTTLNLWDFLDNNTMGVFSGTAGIEVANVSNAVSSMAWYDYGSPEAQRPSAEELQRHISDEAKNKLEFYYDVQHKRKFVFDITEMEGHELIALNDNPGNQVAIGMPANPIYMAQQTVEFDNYAPTVTAVSGIPLLTFNESRLVEDDILINDLSMQYRVVPNVGIAPNFSYKVVHNGFSRYMEIEVPTGTDAQDFEVELEIPVKLHEEVEIWGVAMLVGSDESGFEISAYSNASYDGSVGSRQDIGSPQTVPVGGFNDLEWRKTGTAISDNQTSIILKFSREANLAGNPATIITINNIRLLKASPETFQKPDFSDIDGPDFERSWNWLQQSSFRFFDWNFEEVGIDEGVFVESAGRDKVSISGLGMGIAVSILAVEYNFKAEGPVAHGIAKDRVHRVLRWLDRLDQAGQLFDGTRGFHGMPAHYFKTNKDLYDPVELDADGNNKNLSISTIDWAICAQGIRLARRYFSGDSEIVTLCDKLLLRVKWKQFMIPTHNGDLVKYQDWGGREVLLGSSGYETQDDIDAALLAGTITKWRTGGRITLELGYWGGVWDQSGAWGTSFSEEAELVYLEVLASDKEKSGLGATYGDEITGIDIDAEVYRDRRYYTDETGEEVQKNELHRILYRPTDHYFIRNYFGSGFTYNWLQLWLGSEEIVGDIIDGGINEGVFSSYYTNSGYAFGADVETANNVFGKWYMGLTAASTVFNVRPDGFIQYGRYLGTQGSSENLAPDGEVVQLAPAPYGAVLALPFAESEEVAFFSLQAYADLGFYHEYMGFPDAIAMRNIGDKSPLPNWEHLDINIAPIAMALDHYDKNLLQSQLLSDPYTREAWIELYTSFNRDFSALPDPPDGGASSRLANWEIDALEELGEEELNTGVLVYPNPTTGSFNVRLAIENPGTYYGYLADASGKIYYRLTWELSDPGEHDLSIVDSFDNLADGIYFMAIVGPDGRSITPVIVKD